MHKIDYFRLFLRNQCYLKFKYVISAFSVTMTEQLDPMENPYLIVYDQLGCGFYDPENNYQLTRIDDIKPGEACLTKLDPFIINPADMKCVKKPTETDVGIALMNALLIEEPAKGYFAYLEAYSDAKGVEKLYLKAMQDEPEDESQLKEGTLYIRHYLRLSQCALMMQSMTQIFTPGSTRKTMMPPPGLDAERERLIKELGGNINDATVLAKVQKGLLAYDTAYLKGDPGEGILNSKKTREIVRMKRFLMYGAEPGIEEKVELNTIRKSLNEGWDISRFDAMANAQRAGSYSRGAQTMLGGESVKWMLRASSNINITVKDCGSKLGIPVEGTDEILKKNMGFYAVVNGTTITINEDTLPLVKGKSFMLRSPGFCRLLQTDYCECCVGPTLGINKTGLSAAVARIGDTFLGIFMSAAHAKGIQLAKMDYKARIF